MEARLCKAPGELLTQQNNPTRWNSTPKIIVGSIINLVTQIEKKFPEYTCRRSSFIGEDRYKELSTKVDAVNNLLRAYCIHNGTFLNDGNINATHLNSRGLHLHKQGNITELLQFQVLFKVDKVKVIGCIIHKPLNQNSDCTHCSVKGLLIKSKNRNNP